MALTGYFNGLGLIPDTQHTLSASSSDRKVIASTANAPTTFVVPAGMPEGFSCAFVQAGSGALTIAAGAGVTINAPSSLTAAKQYVQMWLQSVGQDTYVLNQGT